MKKGLLTLAALMLLALGSLAMSSEQSATGKDCPPICKPSDCCQTPCPQ